MLVYQEVYKNNHMSLVLSRHHPSIISIKSYSLPETNIFTPENQCCWFRWNFLSEQFRFIFRGVYLLLNFRGVSLLCVFSLWIPGVSACHTSQTHPKHINPSPRPTNINVGSTNIFLWTSPPTKKSPIPGVMGPFPIEPRKKPSYFPLYWLVNRDPYNGLL